MTAATLALEDVTKEFEGLTAVSGLSFAVRPDSITALIGPNGAGKTTTFNLISGFLRPTAGRVAFGEADLGRLAPHEICRVGIGRAFQTPQIFGRMSLLENVMVAARVPDPVPLLAAGLRLPSVLREERLMRDVAWAQLELLGLAGLAGRPAGTLPFGQQRLLEMARALATDPRLLLLDEPAAGLTQAETRGLRDSLLKVRDRGVTILVVEHNIRFVLRTADHVVVLTAGQKLAEGPPGEIARDPRVIAAYLGRTWER